MKTVIRCAVMIGSLVAIGACAQTPTAPLPLRLTFSNRPVDSPKNLVPGAGRIDVMPGSTMSGAATAPGGVTVGRHPTHRERME